MLKWGNLTPQIDNVISAALPPVKANTYQPGGTGELIDKQISNYNLGQNKMEQQAPSPQIKPQIKDEAVRRIKTRHFAILDLGGRGGLGFPFILSKIVGFFTQWPIWVT